MTQTPDTPSKDELQKHLEANLLDGDTIQAGQMIASSEVLEWAEDFITAHTDRLYSEIMGEKSTMAHIVGSKRVETDYVTIAAVNKIFGKGEQG